jgi:hypothetical protein
VTVAERSQAWPAPGKTRAPNEEILRRLNDDYIRSDQNSDVARRYGAWKCIAGEVVAKGE